MPGSSSLRVLRAHPEHPLLARGIALLVKLGTSQDWPRLAKRKVQMARPEGRHVVMFRFFALVNLNTRLGFLAAAAVIGGLAATLPWLRNVALEAQHGQSDVSGCFKVKNEDEATPCSEFGCLRAWWRNLEVKSLWVCCGSRRQAWIGRCTERQGCTVTAMRDSRQWRSQGSSQACFNQTDRSIAE
jgi:hypothetical protein